MVRRRKAEVGRGNVLKWEVGMRKWERKKVGLVMSGPSVLEERFT
jgi:hypothetical protein